MGRSSYKWFWINPQNTSPSGIATSRFNLQTKLLSKLKAIIPPYSSWYKVVPDTGATSHCIINKHAKLSSNITKTNYGSTVSSANGTDMNTTHTGTVPLSPGISQQAQKGNILNGIVTESLISIRQLCNDNCIAIFTKHNVKILKDNKIIITGTINDQNNLCNTPLTLRPSQVLASAFLF